MGDHSLLEKRADVPGGTDETQRKRPRQARAHATVEAILEATSQVLVDQGYARLTTTRVAERAGVSVGSLYQYFDDKADLVRAVHRIYIDHAFGALRAEALRSEGTRLRSRIKGMLGALLQVKSARPALSTALHATMLELDGPAYLKRIIDQTQALLRQVLDGHRDELAIDDLDLAAFVATNAVDGVVGAAVATGELGHPHLLEAVTQLVIGYLEGHATPSRV